MLVLLVAVKLRAGLDEEKRRAVASGRKSRALFDAAAYASALSTYPGGILVEVNEAWLRLFGYARDEVVGKSLRELGMNMDVDAYEPVVHRLSDFAELRDLHDGLGQELTGISLLAAALASAERNAGRPAAEQLDILVQLARRAVDSCRAMAHGLLPMDFPDNGPIGLLQEPVDLQHDVYGTNIRVDATESAPLRLQTEVLETLYRLAQEAVANSR